MEKVKVIADTDSKSPVAEAFRLLRTNLKFAAVDKSIKLLLVTSSRQMEGKSYTVANLGTVLAQTGARVIIVDCDLRQAEQHTIFGLSNNMGLTGVLTGSGTENGEIAQALKATAIPNLKVLTAGPLPPNPSELLQSDKAKTVFKALAEMADIVLVDSPPVLIRADAAVLSAVVDGVILVIKAGKTKTDAVKQAKERLEKANARIIGTVLNGV